MNKQRKGIFFSFLKKGKLWLLPLCLLFAFSTQIFASDPDSLHRISEEPALPVPTHVDDGGEIDGNYYKAFPVRKAEKSDTVGATALYNQINQQYTGEDFNYDQKEIVNLTWWDRVRKKIDRWLDKLIPDWAFKINDVVYYLLIGLGILALAFVIYKLTATGKEPLFKEDKESKEGSPEWIERNLQKVNLDAYLAQALKDKNYILAIRYLHLINLKKMANQQLIDWDYRKTNHDFLLELGHKDLKDKFAQTIHVYERIWFGKTNISADQFSNYQRLFLDFNQQVG